MGIEWNQSRDSGEPQKPRTVEELRAAYDALLQEQDAFDAQCAAHRKEHAVRDIPNTMEYQRVQLERHVETARLALREALQAAPASEPEATGRGE